jgi:hypothetical protein
MWLLEIIGGRARNHPNPLILDEMSRMAMLEVGYDYQLSVPLSYSVYLHKILVDENSQL